MGNGRGEVYVPHSLAAHDRACEFYSALFAHNSLEADTAVLAAITFIVLFRAENLFIKKSAPLAALGAVVDCFRFCHFALRPLLYAFRRREPDAHGIKVT